MSKKKTQKVTFRRFPTGGQLLNEENLLNGVVPSHIHLTLEQFNEISSRNCKYCGEEPKLTHGDRLYNGIERVKMVGQFNYENTAACCRDCAQIKMGRDEDRMIEFIKACFYSKSHEETQHLIYSFR
jgi:hypothetical protein